MFCSWHCPLTIQDTFGGVELAHLSSSIPLAPTTTVPETTSQAPNNPTPLQLAVVVAELLSQVCTYNKSICYFPLPNSIQEAELDNMTSKSIILFPVSWSPFCSVNSRLGHFGEWEKHPSGPAANKSPSFKMLNLKIYVGIFPSGNHQ